MAKRAIQVEIALNKGYLFAETTAVDVLTETPFTVIERNEYNPDKVDQYALTPEVLR